MANPWTDERMRLLEQYCEDGYTAAEIAVLLTNSALGKAFFTRNAVIGKVVRSGFNLKGTKFGRKPGPSKSPLLRSQTARAVADRINAKNLNKRQRVAQHDENTKQAVQFVKKQRALELTAPASQPCTLADLTNGRCRWPLWGFDERPLPGSALYCGAVGANAADGRPYCRFHKREASGGRQWPAVGNL